MSVVTTNQSKTMGQRVLQMFSDVLNAVSEELENMPRPIVRAFSVTGSTITATCDTITLTPVEEGGGIWEFKLPRYGTWTLTSTTPTGETYTKVVDVDDVKKYVVGLGIEVKRYGYRIKESEPDPYARVEYILDAVGMTPAHMDFENEVFDYGSWRDVWFVADNKPLMLKYDGTVDYYLDPNDYTLREDGETASDVSNTAYEGNAMAQFPLCWIYRYSDDTYNYEIVSNVKYDENYEAYAHTRADGTIAKYIYYAIYNATNIASRLRSLSGTKFNPNTTSGQPTVGNAVIYAGNNGAKYSIETWSRWLLVNTLLVLIGKSFNCQGVFGRGYATEERRVPTSGTLNNKGQFYGYETMGQSMKVYHIEDFYGTQMHALLGLLARNTEMYAKMTPEGTGYRLTDLQGYEKVWSYGGAISGYISSAKYNSYGMIPQKQEGSATTYYCSSFYIPVSSKIYVSRAGWGSGPGNSQDGGLYTNCLHTEASKSTWAYGYRLTSD